MDDEVERHRTIRDSLELELQSLRERLSTVENFPDILDSEDRNADRNEGQMSRSEVLLDLVVYDFCLMLWLRVDALIFDVGNCMTD